MPPKNKILVEQSGIAFIREVTEYSAPLTLEINFEEAFSFSTS